MNLSGQIALVTGGGTGIGKAIAKAMLAEGAKVIIVGRKEEILKEAQAELGSDIEMMKCDITQEDQVIKVYENIMSKHGKIDILINNAGITGSTETLWDYSVKEWLKVLDINLHGTFYCCKAIAPHMIKNAYGRIVNIASVSGKDGNANASAYSSSKAAVIGLTKSLGKELADKNITVNAVTPAGAKTRILDQMSDQHVKLMLSKVPKGRFLEIDELSSMVTWLASEENSFSTGAVFDISGGRSTY